MKRPNLVNFFPLVTEENLSIKAFISLNRNISYNDKKQVQLSRSPIESLRQLRSNKFVIKVHFCNIENNIFKKKRFETDHLGNIFIKYPLTSTEIKELHSIEVFEISYSEGIEFYLGRFIPLKLNQAKKVIICDFDKTLVDTKYSNTKEMYTSLTSPLEKFPKVKTSIEILQNNIKNDYQPFILSASPHFYIDAIRDWLYLNGIYTAAIFLKDFRKILSFIDLDLTFKDLSGQGAYKLSQLLSIIEFVDIPKELILMGDNYESDPIIYLLLSKFLHKNISTHSFLKQLIDMPEFVLNKKQQTILLNKLYRIEDKLRKIETKMKIKIMIRKYKNEELSFDNSIGESGKEIIDTFISN